MNLDKTLQNFISPPEEFSPIPFWFWNDELDEDKIKNQILSLKEHGIDAFVIHPRIGLPDSIWYLSDEFMHYVSFAVKTAKENNMKVVLYDEGMYPSGSANGKVVENNPEFANKCLIELKQSAASVVSAPHLKDTDVLIASLAVKIVDGTLTDSKVINIGESFSEKDVKLWSFTHYIMTFSGSTIRGIHFGEDDLEPRAPKAADLMNIEATKKFIRCTHERYYEVLGEYFGNTIIAMFTDEPSPEGRFALKESIPWTDDFLTYLKEELPIEKLPLLYLKNDENYPAAHLIYKNVVNTLLDERFYAPMSDWCIKHNIALTGHPGKSNDIGHLKHFQIPCQDVVWRYIEPGNDSALTGEHSTMGKCSSDAARHRGLRRNGNEVLGCCGPLENGWLMTFSDVKWYLDWLFVRGVNLILPHAFFYSVTKPRCDERPPDVGFNSYWWENFSQISSYIKRMCYMLTDSTNLADTAFLCGAHDLPFVSPRVFYENQRDFNYLETELLENNVAVSDGYILIQNQRYKNIIVEKREFLTQKGIEVLKEFQKSGGNVLTLFENENFTYIDCAEKLLDYSQKQVCIYPADKNLRATAFIKDGHKVVLLTNEGEEKICGEITVENAAKLLRLDPMSGEATHLEHNFITLMPRESTLLLVKTQYSLIKLDDWYVDGKKVSLSNWLEWNGYENYCGSVTYEADFEINDFSGAEIIFDNVCEMLSLSINESTPINMMLAPFKADITKYLKPGKNTISAKVTNSTAMRFSDARPVSGIIGDVLLKIERNEN